MSIVVILGFRTEDQKVTDENPIGDEFDHMAKLVRLERPWELIVVDRDYPNRVERMIDVFGRDGPWRYLPPIQSEWVRRGMWAVSCSMNSGAICSNGELLVMSGDYNVFEKEQFEFIYDGWFKEGKLYQPVVDFIWGNFQIPKKEEPVVGLNVGPRVVTRTMFKLMNGWDEWYDGSKGVEDEDFDIRMDALIREGNGAAGIGQRFRHPRLVMHKTKHQRGAPPNEYRPMWTHPVTPPWYRLRCNLAYMNRVAVPRTERRDVGYEACKASLHVSDEEIEKIREGCHHEDLVVASGVPLGQRAERNRNICACNRPDREKQLRSYSGWIPTNISWMMDAFEWMLRNKSYIVSGQIDPWSHIGSAVV